MATTKTTTRRRRKSQGRTEKQMQQLIERVMEAQRVGLEVRAARQAHAAQVAAAAHEERRGGVRSIGLLMAISAVMVGALVAGTGLI